MDEVVLIIGLVVLVLLVAPIIAIRALIETKHLRTALSQLSEKVELLAAQEREVSKVELPSVELSSTDLMPTSGLTVSSAPALREALSVGILDLVEGDELNVEYDHESHQRDPSFGQRIVAHLKRNWLVWIGGLALIFGIGYLVQFVGSRIELSPTVRIGGCLLFSLFIIGVGEWLHRQIQAKRWALVDIPNQNYIPATFAAAGMTGLYLTIVFATVMYQLLPSFMALSLIALTAFCCLALSSRFGSLMAILGLIGGYTAPFWVGEGTPDFYIFMTYISVVTTAGLSIRPRVRVPWLPLFISLAHIGWLGLMTFAIEVEGMILWVAIFYPLSVYLLMAVPHQGWTLKLWCRQKSEWPWYHPAGIAVMIGGMQLIAESRLPFSQFTPLVLLLTPLMMLMLPALRRGYSSREAQVIPFIASITVACSLHLYAVNPQASIVLALQALSFWMVVVVLRAYGQFMASYRSVFSYWWAVSCGALMLFSMLVYVEDQFPTVLWLASIISLIGCIGLGWLAKVESRLRSDLVASIHIVLLMLNYIWSKGEIFTALLALQVLIMTMQVIRQWPTLRDVVIKAAVSLLLARLSLLPVIESWQQGLSPQGWGAFANCVPVILMFGFALKMMRKQGMALADWFEGALIHVIAIFVLMQSHYWLTGSLVIFDELDLTSVSFWLIESLVLVGVYSYRQQFSHSMRSFYRWYRYGLLFTAGVCIALLNTEFMPLVTESVSAQSLPLLNGLSLGWLIPGVGLVALAHRGWYPEPIQARWLRVIGGGLVALWLTLSIRQFWQTESMSWIEVTSMAEWITYSAALVLFGALWTYIGVIRQTPVHQTYGLIIVGLAVFKVFISDVSYLDGIWRAASFLGLGLALIGLGWLFQSLKKRHGEAESEEG